jgi:hypothetical protein
MTVVEWLLDSDPSIRWQVMRDLTDEPEDVVAAERSRVASEGWGARLLELQAPDGQWGGGAYHPYWTSTYFALLLLRDLGLDSTSKQARRAVGLVRENVTWQGMLPGDAAWHGRAFFSGEVEPCINGMVLALGAYSGEASEEVLERLLGEQLDDGGWNCWAPPSTRSSFHSTICVLEGLLEYERAKGASAEMSKARARGQEYLLERRMLRKLSSGELIDRDWTLFSFPTWWHYDVLRGLDYLRRAGFEPDDRVAEAIDLVAKNRRSDGRWPLQNPHPGQLHFEMEEARTGPAAGTRSAPCAC